MKLIRLFPDPFVLALLATIIVASLAPATGAFADLVDAAATIAVMLLFFLHGVRTPREMMISGIVNWRLHAAILGSTFVAFPIIGLVLYAIAGPLLPSPVWLGVLFLCAVPSTVQSSIAFTSIARGNVAGAIAAATFSNVLGIILTPLLVLAMIQAKGAGIPLSSAGAIVTQLLLPFAAGQLVRPILGEWAQRRKRLLSLTDRSTIVLAVYSAFSAAIAEGLFRSLKLETLAVLGAVCMVLLAAILFITRAGSQALGFGKEDEIAIVFCGSKKTLASGVPMARVLFAGPQLGAILLPLMMFHQLQLLVCSWLARAYARRAETTAAPSIVGSR